MLLDETVTLKLTANSATGLSVELNPAVSKTNVNVDDYLHNTFTINDGTTDEVLDLGKIVTGQFLFVSTDGPVTVTITQTTDRAYDVTDVLLLNGDFTALKFSNSSGSAVEMTVLVAGSRLTNPGTPGIFSVPEE